MITIRMKGKEYSLHEGVALAGRGKDAKIRIESSSLSRIHARFCIEGNSISIEDLDSKNGTFVNGKQIEEKYELLKGDKIKLADIICEIVYPESAAPSPRVRSGRKKGSVLGLVIKLAIVAVLLVAGYYVYEHIRGYVPQEQRKAQNLLKETEKEFVSFELTYDIKENENQKTKFKNRKFWIVRIPEKYNREHAAALNLINRIDHAMLEIETRNRLLRTEQNAFAELHDINGRVASGMLPHREALKQLTAFQQTYPDSKAAAEAVKKISEIEDLILEQERKDIAEAEKEAKEMAASGKFREAVALIDECLNKGFSKVTKEEAGILSTAKHGIILQAKEYFAHFVEKIFTEAISGDIDLLKEKMAGEYARIGLDLLHKDYDNALARVDDLKAKRLERARKKITQDINRIGELKKKRLYIKAAALYEEVIQKLTEPELKEEIEYQKRLNDLYLAAKWGIMRLARDNKGLDVPGIGFISSMTENEIELMMEFKSMPIGWERIRHDEFLMLLGMALNKYPDAALYTAYGVFLLEKGEGEKADEYFARALRASDSIGAMYPVLFSAYKERVAKRKEEEEKQEEKKQEEQTPERIAYYTPDMITKTYYVSPSGSNGGPGSFDKPWKTIAQACAKVKPGEMVVIREGTYHERIKPSNSGEQGAPIVFKNFVGEAVVITGSSGNAAELVAIDWIILEGLVFDGEDRIFCAIYINDHGDHITIKDCIMRNYRNPENTGGYGIWAAGGGVSYLTVDNCRIYRCGTDNPQIENGSNIHIFKNSDNIVIRNCDIYESYTEDGLHLGAFGMVTDVLVENCRFWGNKENAIDIKLAERVIIRNCEIWGHRDSPTGGGAGIVVHMGARDVLFDRCTFYDNGHGLAIQYNNPGQARATENITVQRSVFYDNIGCGINVAGGAVPGKLRNIRLYNNVLFNNEYGIELYAHEGGDAVLIEVKNNIFMENTRIGFASNRRVKEVYRDHNNYFGSNAGRVQAEKHGLRKDPKFINVAERDFRLLPSSPMIDKGIDVGLPFIIRAPDIGAYEYGEEYSRRHEE